MKNLEHKMCCQSRKRAFPASLLPTGHTIPWWGLVRRGITAQVCPQKGMAAPTLAALPALPLPSTVAVIHWLSGQLDSALGLNFLTSCLRRQGKVQPSLIPSFSSPTRVPKQPIDAIEIWASTSRNTSPFLDTTEDKEVPVMQKYARNVPVKVSTSSWSTA